MRRRFFPARLVFSCAFITPLAPQAPGPQKADMVSVTGCVTPGPGGTWLLTSAGNPVVLKDNRALASTRPVTTGKNRYKLIGIMELDVPSHKGHTVTVKGLLVLAEEKRINVTSVQHVAPTCPPSSEPARAKPPK